MFPTISVCLKDNGTTVNKTLDRIPDRTPDRIGLRIGSDRIGPVSSLLVQNYYFENAVLTMTQVTRNKK